MLENFNHTTVSCCLHLQQLFASLQLPCDLKLKLFDDKWVFKKSFLMYKQKCLNINSFLLLECEYLLEVLVLSK